MQVRCNMPATRTNAVRHCLCEPVQPGLAVVETHEGKRNATKQTGRYLVREHAPTYCRVFQVTKESQGGGETYWVSLAATLAESTCDCPGYESNSLCKHLDAVWACTRPGGPFPARSEQDVTCFYSEEDHDQYAM